MTRQLACDLVDLVYILDNPTVELDPRDIEQRLRDHGNSVPVVEHDRAVTRAANWIVDIGRRAGELLFYGRRRGPWPSRRSVAVGACRRSDESAACEVDIVAVQALRDGRRVNALRASSACASSALPARPSAHRAVMGLAARASGDSDILARTRALEVELRCRLGTPEMAGFAVSTNGRI